MNKYFYDWAGNLDLQLFAAGIIFQFLAASLIISIGWIWFLPVPIVGWLFALLCLNRQADELENGYALRYEEGDRRTRTN